MHYMQDTKKKMQRQTQTTMDRQYKCGHRINWAKIKGSNGLDKGPTTMEVIHSYPSLPSGWRQELMMMMMMMTTTTTTTTMMMMIMTIMIMIMIMMMMMIMMIIMIMVIMVVMMMMMMI